MNLNLEKINRTSTLLVIIAISYATLMIIIRFLLWVGFESTDNQPFLSITKEQSSWFIDTFMLTPLKFLGWMILWAALLIVPALVFKALYKELM